MPKCTCEIQWIDKAGEPTPDTNVAVKQVRCNFSAIKDRRPPPSQWFSICTDHLKRMPNDGSWEVRDLDSMENFAEKVKAELVKKTGIDPSKLIVD